MSRLFFLALGFILFPPSVVFLIGFLFTLRAVLANLKPIHPSLVLASLMLGYCLVACTPALEKVAQAQTIDRPEGVASWYGAEFAGRPTANGEIYDPSQMTAAHRTLPFGTFVRVTNIKNGLNAVVRINDRGPFAKGRIIDVSRAAAEVLGMVGSGIAQVRLELISNEPAPTAAVGPQTNTVVAADAALAAYNVISADYRVGQLLIVTSPTQSNPVIVRVASNAMPISSGVNMFISSALFSIFGEHVTVLVGN